MSEPEKLITEADLKPHAWDAQLIAQYGNARCSRCSIQYKYYKESIDRLNAWSEAEKQDDRAHFNRVMKNLECERA